MKTWVDRGLLIAVMALAGTASAASLVWPPPPDTARLAYVRSIECRELRPAGGLFAGVKRLLGGADEREKLSLPFDVAVVGDTLYLVCQNVPALVAIDRETGRYRMLRDEAGTLRYPVTVCQDGAGGVFVADSESRIVYRVVKRRLEPFVAAGLSRPTGVAALAGAQRVFIVDTGEHAVKIYDYAGNLLRIVSSWDADAERFHFPTFAARTPDGHVLVNDGLNYRVVMLDMRGEVLRWFGAEGDGPGRFARPKGIAVDSDHHVYVVDNLFDNYQVFDTTGRVLLVVGSAGQQPGEFWSPAGADMVADTLFVADTFNDRIQVFAYLGGPR